MSRARRRSTMVLGLILWAGSWAAAGPSTEATPPDPASVERYGPAYRYPRAGWVVLHIEGAPYDRGYQHGRLLAPEIADYVTTLATKRSPNASAEAWREV